MVTRSFYGGKVQAEIDFPGHECVVLLMRQGVWPVAEGSGAACISTFTLPTQPPSRARHVEFLDLPDGEDVSIEDADFLVAIGRGIGSSSWEWGSWRASTASVRARGGSTIHGRGSDGPAASSSRMPGSLGETVGRSRSRGRLLRIPRPLRRNRCPRVPGRLCAPGTRFDFFHDWFYRIYSLSHTHIDVFGAAAWLHPSFELWSPIGWLAGSQLRKSASRERRRPWRTSSNGGFTACLPSHGWRRSPIRRPSTCWSGPASVAARDEAAGRRLPDVPEQPTLADVGYGLIK